MYTNPSTGEVMTTEAATFAIKAGAQLLDYQPTNPTEMEYFIRESVGLMEKLPDVMLEINARRYAAERAYIARKQTQAFEPIVVARKPLAGTVAANVLAYGTGALNIDACRVGDEVRTFGGSEAARAASQSIGAMRGDRSVVTVSGRFPSNVLLDESQADALDAQSGTSTSRIGKPRGAAAGAGWGMTATGSEYDDAGGASRFFPTFRYVAKAPGTERPEVDGVAHATVKPLDLMRWLVRLVTRRGGHVLDLYAGSGTTGEAALLEGMECTLIELEADHLPLILARVRKPLQPSMFGDWEEAS